MNLSIVSAKYVAPLKVELHFNDDTRGCNLNCVKACS